MLLLKEVKQGDKFYEYTVGTNLQVFALEDGREDPETKGKWFCRVRSMYGEFEMCQTEGLEHYGPKISRDREYMD